MPNSRDTIKPLIIPVFIPHWGCPHRCVFCNQKVITSQSSTSISPRSIEKQIYQYHCWARNDRGPAELAFYGGNFLGLSKARIHDIIQMAKRFIEQGLVRGIRFSTRPDTIVPQRLEWIVDVPVTAVEIGVQSMDDSVLKASRRGHSSQHTQQAVQLLKHTDYRVGIQLMTGLPGDTPERLHRTGQRVVALQPDFVRIYPTLVLKGSPLESLFQSGHYRPQSLSQSVRQVADLYKLFMANGIAVIRMGLQTSDDLNQADRIMAGPFHPAFGHLVHCHRFLDKAVEILEGRTSVPKTINIHVNPRSISIMGGWKNQNIQFLKHRFGIHTIRVVADTNLTRDQLIID